MSKRSRINNNDDNTAVVVAAPKKRRVCRYKEKMAIGGWKNIRKPQNNSKARALRFASIFRLLGSGNWEYMLGREYLSLNDIVSLAFACKPFWRVLAHLIKWEKFYLLTHHKNFLPVITTDHDTPDVLKFGESEYERYNIQYNIIYLLRGNKRQHGLCSGCFGHVKNGVPKSWLRQEKYCTNKCLSCFMRKHEKDTFEDLTHERLKLKSWNGKVNVFKMMNFQTYKGKKKRGIIIWPELPSCLEMYEKPFHKGRWRGRIVERTYFRLEVDAYIRGICIFILNSKFKLSREKAKKLAGKILISRITHWYKSRTDEIIDDIEKYVYKPYIEKLIASNSESINIFD